MKRFWILALALVAVMLAAVPAAAGPPEGKGPKQPPGGHPPGETCADAGMGAAVVWTATGFTVTLNDKEWACVDIPIMPDPGEPWSIDVSVGSAREVWLMVKDAQPGDGCWGTENTDADIFYSDVTLNVGNDVGGCAGDSYTDSDPAQLVFGAKAAFRGKVTDAEPVSITVTLP
jgi:hypothetical protein